MTMAPLRFRAWHNGKMYVSFRYENICGTSFIGGSLGGGMDVSYEVDGKETVVMQSTGLFDKAGKEIFEGDIVLWPDTESEYVNVEVGEVKVAETTVNSFGPVVFKDGSFGVESPGGEAVRKGFYPLKEFLSDYCPPEDIETIGNIYETPDLLSPTP